MICPGDGLCGSRTHPLPSYTLDNRRVSMSVDARRRRSSWRRLRSDARWCDMTTRARCLAAGTGSTLSSTCDRLAESWSRTTPDDTGAVYRFVPDTPLVLPCLASRGAHKEAACLLLAKSYRTSKSSEVDFQFCLSDVFFHQRLLQVSLVPQWPWKAFGDCWCRIFTGQMPFCHPAKVLKG